MKKRLLRALPALLLSMVLCRLSGTAYAAVGTVNVSAGDDPRPGTNISFTITFTAEGDVAGVQGTVTASEHLRFVSAQCAQNFASASLNAGSFVLAGATRDAQGSVSLEYTYYVDWDTPQDTPVSVQVEDVVLITGDGQRTKAAVVGIASAAATVKGEPVGTPSPTPTATATPTPTPTATASSETKPTGTPSAPPADSPQGTGTPSPEAAGGTPTASPETEPTATASPETSPTATASPSPTAGDSPGPAGGATPAPSPEGSAAPAESSEAVPSAPATGEPSPRPEENPAPAAAENTQRTAGGERQALIIGQLSLLGAGAAAYGAVIFKKKK